MSDQTKPTLDLEGIEVYTDALSQALGQSDAVQLPFPALFARWRNGDAKSKAQGDLFYFGGWSIGEKFLAPFKQQPDLKNWLKYTDASENGEQWEAYGNRAVTVAVIGKRIRWFKKGTKEWSAHPSKGVFTQTHAQYLTLLFNAPGAEPLPLVLTLTGYAETYMRNAVSEWVKMADKFCAEANIRKLPISAFMVTLGTHGTERKTEMVGPVGSQKPINPVQACITDKVSMEKRYIGKVGLALAASLVKDADTWLKAWSGKEQATPPEAHDEVVVGEPF